MQNKRIRYEYSFTLPLGEGFDLLKKPAPIRTYDGVPIGRPRVYSLLWRVYSRNRAATCCWFCKRKPELWVGSRDRFNSAQTLVTLVPVYQKEQTGELVLFNRDHIIPVAYGGAGKLANLRIACERCNVERGMQLTPDEVAFAKSNPKMYSVEKYSSQTRVAQWRELMQACAADMPALPVKPHVPTPAEPVGTRAERKRAKADRMQAKLDKQMDANETLRIAGHLRKSLTEDMMLASEAAKLYEVSERDNLCWLNTKAGFVGPFVRVSTLKRKVSA